MAAIPSLSMSAKHVADGLAVPDHGTPDLQTQLEGILDSVWKAEADWRCNDRLDIALKTRRTEG